MERKGLCNPSLECCTEFVPCEKGADHVLYDTRASLLLFVMLWNLVELWNCSPVGRATLDCSCCKLSHGIIVCGEISAQ